MTIKDLFKTAPVTTLLLISFISLFALQVLSGVDANNPLMQELLSWGANFLPLTMVNEPWRLVSSGFLHIGLMHLLFNSFAMYFFGQVAEPMFGSVKFLLLFLLAVIGGNLLNSYITWQSFLAETGQFGISAGASGGIMGIGAALLVAAFFKISVNGMVLNLKTLILIMGINLVYGFAVPGIDNAGHIGGALTGLLIALPIAIAHRQHSNVLKAVIPDYTTNYTNYQLDNSADPDDRNNIYNDNYPQNSVNSVHNDPINSQLNRINDSPFSSNKQLKPAAKSAIIWQVLPWVILLLIAIGFIWWWFDIHNQIMPMLADAQ